MDDDRAFGFLRDCLASRLTASPRLPDPPADTDFSRLFSLLTDHRLAAHFYILAESQREIWPDDFRERLRLLRYGQMLYGDQCRLRVGQVLSALTEARVPVIVLKGWAYIQTIYGGDHSQRLCEDVDILVRLENVDAAEEIFSRLGCQLERESWAGYNRRYLNGGRYFFPEQPGNPADKFSIGFHWGLFHVPAYDSRQVDVAALFERARPLQVAGVDALELSAEDEIVYACAHLGLHHRFDTSLFRYYELAAQIVRAGAGLDWQTVAERAAAWRQVIPVRGALRRVESLWTGILPRSAREALAGLSPTLGERFVNGWVERTGGRVALVHLLTWLAFPDWRQRVLIMLQDIFPSREYMQWRYGRAPLGIWPLLYFRRLFQAIATLIHPS